MPPRVARRVDLDDCGSEVGEYLAPVRARDCESEIEHHHTIERSALGRPRPRRRAVRKRRFGSLVAHCIRVLARMWYWSLYPPRREVEPVDDADLTQVTVLSALHVRHCTFGQQRRVAQRFLGCAHRL